MHIHEVLVLNYEPKASLEFSKDRKLRPSGTKISNSKLEFFGFENYKKKKIGFIWPAKMEKMDRVHKWSKARK